MMADDGYRLMIGLGNPGTDYENTYHNAGALALDAVASSLSDGSALRWDIHKKLFSYARIHNWIFVKPLTFMNVSGVAIREASRKFNIPPDAIVILHDDSDLPLGTWKISRGRGAAGHHGVESAVATLGTNDFVRIRIGIRPENEHVRKKAEEFVLRKITKTAAGTLKKTFGEIAEALQKET
jgi:PTH1 family peptidyl-tRNA hydrolase